MHGRGNRGGVIQLSQFLDETNTPFFSDAPERDKYCRPNGGSTFSRALIGPLYRIRIDNSMEMRTKQMMIISTLLGSRVVLTFLQTLRLRITQRILKRARLECRILRDVM